MTDTTILLGTGVLTWNFDGFEIVPVRLNGVDLFWFKDKDNGGPLAPVEHFNADGTPNVDAMFESDSYAHVHKDGNISRYGEKIGRVEDLEPRVSMVIDNEGHDDGN